MYNLVTGAAGFIGFHLTLELLKKNKKVIGIDNINDYYDPTVKKNRLKKLKTFKKFKFLKIDISHKKNFNNLKKYKIDIVYHLAAQAGVRYSFYNPEIYIQSNIDGFFNVLSFIKEKKIKKVIFASSSSVYGNKKNFPVKENQELNPSSLYGITKKNNEEMAKYFADTYNIKIIGLRFFTVFGEYGRPDMFLIKFLDAYKNKKFFYLNNFGKHIRDFTYIKDVISLVLKLKFYKKFEVFNVCSNRPVKLSHVIKIFKKFDVQPKIKKIKFQIGDVYKTHGSNRKILKNTKSKKMTKFDDALEKLINWYNKTKKN